MPTSDITINLSVNMQYCNGVIKYISLCNKKTQKKHRTEQDMFINQNAWKNYNTCSAKIQAITEKSTVLRANC